MMKIMIEPDQAHLARRGATIFSQLARACVGLRGRFMVALSGGSSPRPMHRLLGEEPYLCEIPWGSTHIFWVDERCVPTDDPASSYGVARVDFLERVPIPDNQVHPMPPDLPPNEGAAAYEKELLDFFQIGSSDIPEFDLICLGIGGDGHTASLFPGHSALGETKRLVVAVKGGDPDVPRLTMTLPLINNAREIVFPISGIGKAMILKAILQGPRERFPAQMIRPAHGHLTYLVDREAASMLTP